MPDNKLIKILFFGDIVGKPARKAIKKVLPELKKELNPDLVIANAENLAHGIGVTKKTLAECLDYGIDFFTSGNHIWGKPDIYEIFKDAQAPIIRPANYGHEMPGSGSRIVMVGTKQLLIINLHGQVFIEEEFMNPFHAIDQILEEYKQTELAGIIIDFHGEATSEKTAFGWHVDGRVSAMVGTHTHVPTADNGILTQGTAYITDIGMVGLKDSVIGIDKDIILDKFLDKQSRPHDIADSGECVVNAVMITIDSGTKKSTSIDRIHREVNI